MVATIAMACFATERGGTFYDFEWLLAKATSCGAPTSVQRYLTLLAYI